MYCTKCGYRNPEENNFCTSCGTSISGKEAYADRTDDVITAEIHSQEYSPKTSKATIEGVGMECANHSGRVAVGTCVNCGKGICSDCRTELGGKLYCQSCANEVFEQAKGKDAGVFIAFSIISAIVAIFFFPIIFGPLGIALGYIAYRRNSRVGTICMIVALVCMIIGFIWGAMTYWENSSYY